MVGTVKKYISVEFEKYVDEFNLGISFSIHNDFTGSEGNHGHLWIDLGFWYIEISFMEIK